MMQNQISNLLKNTQITLKQMRLSFLRGVSSETVTVFYQNSNLAIVPLKQLK